MRILDAATRGMKTIAALIRAPITAFRRRYNKDIGDPLPESVAKRQKPG